MSDKKLTPEEMAEIRKKENKNVLRNYRIKQGDTTVRSGQPDVAIPSSMGERGKLLAFPNKSGSTAESRTTETLSGNPGEGTIVEAELNKP